MGCAAAGGAPRRDFAAAFARVYGTTARDGSGAPAADGGGLAVIGGRYTSNSSLTVAGEAAGRLAPVSSASAQPIPCNASDPAPAIHGADPSALESTCNLAREFIENDFHFLFR